MVELLLPRRCQQQVWPWSLDESCFLHEIGGILSRPSGVCQYEGFCGMRRIPTEQNLQDVFFWKAAKKIERLDKISAWNLTSVFSFNRIDSR